MGLQVYLVTEYEGNKTFRMEELCVEGERVGLLTSDRFFYNFPFLIKPN